MHGIRTGAGIARAAGAALLAAVLTACTTGGTGTAAAPRSSGPQPTAAATTARAPLPPADAAHRQAALWRSWHLTALPPAPAPPAVPPVRLRRTGPVPVVSSIPTRDRVVFITIDDGAEKDPRFVRMLRDLKVPVTMFLTDAAISSDYGYFRRLQQLGDTVQNHTLTHPDLRTLDAAAQRNEICGQQHRLTAEYGRAPTLFRPPYGAYNAATLTAARECGLGAVVLWKESMQIKDMQYQTGDRRLRPGDIVLAHFRGPAELKHHTMTEMFADLLRRIQRQGFAVARLDDYLRP